MTAPRSGGAALRRPGHAGRVHRRIVPVLLVLAALPLAGCSSTPHAAAKASAAPVDFGKTETTAAVAYYHAHEKALDPSGGADQATVFGIAKDYCKQVALQGRQAANTAYLGGTDGLPQDTVLAYQGLAKLYCPVTMAAG